MQRATPFARATAMFAAISAAMALNPFEQHLALAALEPYQSQGKGGRHRQRSRHCVAMDKRAAVKARNRRKHKAHA